MPGCGTVNQPINLPGERPGTEAVLTALVPGENPGTEAVLSAVLSKTFRGQLLWQSLFCHHWDPDMNYLVFSLFGSASRKAFWEHT